MAIDNLLRQTLTVYRKFPAKGQSGGEYDYITPVYTNLPCSIQPVKADWLILFQQRNIDITHIIFINTGTIQVGDELVSGTRRFFVKGVRDLITLGKVIAIDCAEIPGKAS
jgi:hypothetical protein